MRKQWSRFLRVVFCLSPSGCFPHLLLARESSLVWKRPCQGEQMQGGRSENRKDTTTHWNISPSGSCAAASFSFFYDFTFIIKKSVLPVQAGSWFVLLVVSQRCPFNFPCTNTWAKSSNACQARSKQLTKCVCSFWIHSLYLPQLQLRHPDMLGKNLTCAALWLLRIPSRHRASSDLYFWSLASYVSDQMIEKLVFVSRRPFISKARCFVSFPS